MTKTISVSSALLYTIGHSSRSIDEFVGLLQTHHIGAVADVRRFPASRRYPHFNAASLVHYLSNCGIAYEGFEELGGRRSARPDSHNTAWRNPSFRGYADYMETPVFAGGIDRLLVLADSKPTAVMCAEALWWQCHRSLIADYVKARSHEVLHIVGPNKLEPHPYTSAAHLENGELSYRATQASLDWTVDEEFSPPS